MADCRKIVNTALRKLGRLGAGREPRLVDATDTLEALQSFYSDCIASGAFGRLSDITPTGTNFVASGNQRIFRTTADELSVTLPVLISEEWQNDYGHWREGYYGTTITVSTVGTTTTVNVETAQPRSCSISPRDGSPVVISDQIGGETRSWLYDGTIKRWQAIDDMTLDSEAPRSAADPDGLAACVALRMADQYGLEPSATTQRAASRYKQTMTHRYGMRDHPLSGVYM